MENIEICNLIKKYFQDAGLKKINEEDKNNIYGIESELKINNIDFTFKITYHKKPGTIIFQVKTHYKFNKRKFSKTLFLADLFNMNSMDIGCIAIDSEIDEINSTSNLYLSNRGVDEIQFKTTLERILIQLQLYHALVQKVDQNDEDPLTVMINFNHRIKLTMKGKTDYHSDFSNQYISDTPKCGPLEDVSEMVIMDMQLCLQNEGLLIINESERLSSTELRSNKIIQSWCKIESGVFQVQALYTPELDTVGFEIRGFSPVKDEYASNYIYLFNWINQIQMKNWWVLYPASNRVLLRGGFVISDGKLDKYQFSKLIKNSIENLKLFYPLVTDQESIGKSVTDSILRFSKDNIIKIGRFNNN